MDNNKKPSITFLNQDVHHQDEDDEALSLRGLIVNSSEVELDLELEHQNEGRTSSSSDHFEFLHDRSSEMSHAEDIIFCGKLIPYRKPHQYPNQVHHKRHHFLKFPADDQKRQSFHSRRSESLNDIKTGRSNSALQQHQIMRNSRSLDYGKLYGNKSPYRWSENLEIERSSSTKSSFSGTGAKEKIVPTPRPRWYMMFGVLKFPPEMDFQDIKNRQVRRNNDTSGRFFAPADGDGKALVNRVRCSSSWHLLRVLSCKDDASVSVATPFGRLQQI